MACTGFSGLDGCTEDSFNYQDYGANSVTVFGVTSWKDCRTKCRERNDLVTCKYWTFYKYDKVDRNKHNYKCRLMEESKKKVNDPRVISGSSYCNTGSSSMFSSFTS